MVSIFLVALPLQFIQIIVKSVFLLLILPAFCLAQNNTKEADSTKVLSEVVVRGFETERKLLETPASISLLTIKDLQRFDNTSMVAAMNTIAGVRMEERSPGSYRLSIRGSSIRSPFGVRNVKVYWNEIPFTDANGISYLNLIDMQTIGKVEVIKGPAGSLYGAGTGGVILLGSATANTETGNRKRETKNTQIQSNLQFGDFGTQRRSFALSNATDKSNSVLSYAHQQSDGYRENSNMVRDILNLRSSYFVSDAKTINVSALYADIQYRTPGGLTQAQFEANPRAARPSTAAIAGPVAQKAGIYQKVFNLGASQEYRWNQHFSNVTSVFGSLGDFKNPFLTNYETRNEQSLGGRTRFSYRDELRGIPFNITAGGEFIRTASLINNYGNRRGVLDTLQTSDDIKSWQHFYFGQIELDLPHNIILTIGASSNHVKYDFLRRSDATRGFKPVDDWLPTAVSPRIALLKKFKDQISVHASISRGFSPPTVTEFVTGYRSPSYFTSLAPEKGLNYEIGTRGELFRKRLNFDVTFFSFQLQDVIVRGINAAGIEVFNNAGLTKQKGLEVSLNALLISNENGFVSNLRAFTTFTYNDFKFTDFVAENQNFSGKRLPGTPQNVWITGFDLATKHGAYLNSTLNFTDKIWLNNANTFSANSYWLLAARMGYKIKFNHFGIDLYAGGDNLLNQIYSLGNDFNAVGNRFFNPAASRNLYAGINFLLY